jgi:hypothetical protein
VHPALLSHHPDLEQFLRPVTPADLALFSAGLDAINAPAFPPQWAMETDGERHTRTFYLIHSHSGERIDCRSRSEATALFEKFSKQIKLNLAKNLF